jgi:hypothetical protein
MNLTQLETVETELKRTRYSQNKVLKLTDLKRRSREHQERLKRSWDGKDMAKTRFRGFLRRNWASGAYLQETRGWNMIMLINIGVYMQRVMKRASGEGI